MTAEICNEGLKDTDTRRMYGAGGGGGATYVFKVRMCTSTLLQCLSFGVKTLRF